MRRLLSILIVFCMLFNTALGYTLTVNGVQLTDVDEGRTVEIYAPEKAGYNFTGWEVDSGESVTFEDATSRTTSFAMPEGNTSIIPVYTPIPTTTPTGEPTPSTTPIPSITYTVTYDVGTATNGTAPANQTKTHGVDLTLQTNTGNLEKSATQVNGYTITFDATDGSCATSSLTAQNTTTYTYDGWSTTSGGAKAYDAGETYNIDAPITLYPYFESSTTNGSIILPTPTQSGYIFNGWYTAASDGDLVGMAGEEYVPTSTTTVYAHWVSTSAYIGKYVSYTPTVVSNTVATSVSGHSSSQTYYPSNTTSWKIFKYETDHIEIISSGGINVGSTTTTSLSLGGVVGYRYVVQTLNNICSDYVNTTYATSARSLGCTAESEAVVNNVAYGKSGFPYQDSYYSDDVAILNTQINGAYPLRTGGTQKTYLASRRVSISAPNESFIIRTYNNETGATPDDIVYMTGGSTNSYTYAFNVRPIVTLKTNVYLASGSGTPSDPYILGISNIVTAETYTNGSASTVGGTWTGSGSYSVGETVTLTATPNAGYLFDGWEVISGSATLDDATSATTTFTITEDVTIRAKFVSTYTVSYELGTATSGTAPANQAKESGVDLTLRTNTGNLAKETEQVNGYTVTFDANTGECGTVSLTSQNTVSYTYNGWNTAADGTGDAYIEGGTYSQDASITLYPAFTPNSINGGITLPTATARGYIFKGWYTAENGGTLAGIAGDTYVPSETIILYAQWDMILNQPVLGTGMTPVNWNGSSWVTTTESNWDYNYNIATANTGTVAGDGTAKWANAKTSDGSMYVWIPRYTYKIVSGANNGNAVSWSSDAYVEGTDVAGKIEVRFSDGTVDDTSDGYLSMPAFKFGNNEVEGIWVAKYEASRSSSSSTIPQSLPNASAWSSTAMTDMFTYSKNLNPTLNSHLIKNSEWAIVSYLTNAIGRMPYKNNTTDHITGYSGATMRSAAVASTNTSSTFAYNTVNGVKASTTHNIYGIYDMSGGMDERTASACSPVATLTNAGTAYYDYSTGTTAAGIKYYVNGIEVTNRKGIGTDELASDAVGSDGVNAWDGTKVHYTSNSDYAYICKGATSADDESNAGIFDTSGNSGLASNNTKGFRVVFVILPSDYTVIYDANRGSGAPASQTKTIDVDLTISSTVPTRSDEYTFTGWNTAVDGSGISYASGATYSNNASVILYAQWQRTPNTPVLASGLTPVDWNGSAWVTTTENDWGYNYNVASAYNGTVAGDGTAKWANAQTSDGSMYVWIPRYTYKIVSGEHESAVSWSSDLYTSSDTAGKILVRYSNGTEDDTSDGYLSHPSFTFGEDELEGIWVAKFEASKNDATSSSVGSGTIPTFKPSVKGWGSLTASQAFDYAYNLNRSLESHLIKNSEWSAVAYLTNAVGRIPYRNNNSNYITGNAGSTENKAAATSSNAYDSVNGVRGSTTHNIYGIYDMNAGRNEWVSAYYSGGESTYLVGDVSNKTYAGSLYDYRNTKYVEVYNEVYSENSLGDAMYETSTSSSGNTSWDSDASGSFAASTPAILRGGYQDDTGANSGIFAFKAVAGATNAARGFRATLAIADEYTIHYDLNGASGTEIPDQTKAYGESITLASATLCGEGETFYGWNTRSDGSGAWYGAGDAYTDNASVTLYAYWIRTPNAPVLASGLTPVNWSDGEWVATTESNWDYSYNNLIAATTCWANAQTADGSMYVWIPRYTYKIVSGEHESAVSWSSDLYTDSSVKGRISVRYSNGIEDNTSNDYLVHPAFKFGDDELEGIWVAKFEASRSDATASSVGTSTTPASKPGVKSWASVTVSQAYDAAYNLNRDLDSHLLRNSEWSAVAYLTNAIGRIPYRNTNSNYITGIAGTTENAAASTSTTNSYSTGNGMRGSTTHTIHGIYDMNAGLAEMVSTYYSGGASTYLADDIANKTYAGSLYANRKTKYVEVYDEIYDENATGQAMYEVSASGSGNTSWDSDKSVDLDVDTPVLQRGGATSTTAANSGIFYFYPVTGVASDSRGFRVALAIADEYNIYYDGNGADSTEIPSQTKAYGANATISSTIPTRNGYIFYGWNTQLDGSGDWYNAGATYSDNSSVTLYAQWQIAPNAPVLGTGMTPVNWNGSTWVTTTESNWDYNYNVATANTGTVAGDGTAKWANAQTSDGSMYVWIPRYTYKIESGYHLSGITSWNSDSYVKGTDVEGRILIKFSNSVEDDTSDDYLSHPAFKFGDDELEGIWVAKYEASRNDATSSSAGSGTTVSSKPGVISWDNLSVSAQYDNAYNMNRDLDSHLMRNSEWGAVAYLTNAIGRMPYMNANTSYITGYVGTSSAWNTVDGVKASTTHNIYGIYDMAGGRNEAVAAYYKSGTSTYLSGDTSNKAYGGSLYTNRNTKYVELYNTLDSDSRAYSANNPGDAVYEVSGSSSGYTAWDGAKSLAIKENNPFIVRSGPNSEVKSSIFHFTNTTGEAGTRGFRPALAVTSKLSSAFTSKITGSDGLNIPASSVTTITFGKYENYSSVGTWGDGVDVSFLGNDAIQMFASGTDVYVLSKSTINLNENCANMFDGFTNLTAINGLSTVQTNRVTDMSYMFSNCSSLTQLDLTSFNTSNVTNMSNMFNGCNSLVKVAVMPTIFVTTSVSSSTNMFNNCTSIIGPKGTTYSSSHIDKTYAVLDGTTPGYFWGRNITTIELGKYVTYIPSITSYTTSATYTGNCATTSTQTFKPSNTTSWRILTNGTGTQLISAGVVKDSNSKGLTMQGKAGYRYLVYYLNRICSKYVNPKFAVSGRSLGSYSSSVNTIASSNVAWNTGNFDGRQDTYYKADKELLSKAGITGSTQVWAASRAYKRTDDVRDDYLGRTMNRSGSTTSVDLYRINKYGTSASPSQTYPIHPIVTLRDNEVYITGGSGTSTDPYTLGYSLIVSYDANGGNAIPASQIKIEGTGLTLSSVVPTRTGYAFTGWNTKADGSGDSYASGATYSEDLALTLYAQWNTVSTYTVTYNANGGSGAPDSQIKTQGINLTLSSTVPTYAGHTFTGWNTAQNGSGTSYASGATYSTDADATLYAQWEIQTLYTVTAQTYTNGSSSTTGGTWTGAGTYDSGATVTITATPNSGYAFRGWEVVTGSATGINTSSATTSFTISGNVTIRAKFAQTYTVAYNANGGSGAPSSQTKYYGENLTLSSTTPTYVGHTFTGWNTAANGSGTSYAKGATYTANAGTTLYAQWRDAFNQPTIIANKLIPLNWNGSSWVETTVNNWDYNYTQASTWSNSVGSSSYGVGGDGTAKWANAKTSDGSMYVWIPRYTYKIVSGESNSSAVSWTSDSYTSSNTAGKIQIKWSNGTTDDTSNGYLSMPGFKFGTTELTGIWVAKYEASNSNSTPMSLPGVAGWKSLSITNMFTYSKNLNTELNSHLIKNSEWALVSYLTNAIGRMPYANNTTDYITGYAGATMRATAVASTNTSSTFAWNTTNGVRGSTTHNVYGVYDMSGGLADRTATSYRAGTNSTFQSAGSAYYDYLDSSNAYYVNGVSITNNKGIGIPEFATSVSFSASSNSGWDGVNLAYPGSSNKYIVKGGESSGSNTGIFGTSQNSGDASNATRGFRVVLCVAP